MPAPTLVELAVEGKSLALRFSESLSAILPSRNRFIVTVNGVRNYVTDVARLQPYDTTIALSLTSEVQVGANVTVTYISVNGRERVGFGEIRSASTLEAASYFRASPANNMTGTATQAITITSDDSSLAAGESSLITFTFTRDPGQTFTYSDIVVSGGTLSGLSGSGLTRTAVFTADGTDESLITVGSTFYTDIFGNFGSSGSSGDLGAGNNDFTDSSEVVTVAEDTALSGNLLMGSSSLDGPLTVTSFSIEGETGPFAIGTAYNINQVGLITIGSN
jgi:uncharacterized repeat protein (TIGR02059 family)